MSATLFIVEFIFVFLATLAILHFYGNLRKTHFLVILAVFVSWFFSFLIIFILPMDVTNTLYNDCLKRSPSNHSQSISNNNRTVYDNGTSHGPQTALLPVRKCIKPWSHLTGHVLPDMWRVIYWSSLLLSWILLPIMQSYVYAGEFTVWGKFKTAMYENALWYGSYILIFGGLLIYVAIDPNLSVDAETLKLICITASNTWGLLLLVLLLGYGLVDLPRNIWNMSLPNLRLETTFFRVAKLNTEKEDACEDLSKLLSEVKVASEEIKYNNNLRKYLEVIMSKCPSGNETSFSKGTEDYVDYDNERPKFTMKELINLHKNIIVMTHRAARTQYQWNAALNLTFYLEDVLEAESNRDKCFISSFTEHNQASRSSMKLKWYWHVIFRPWILRVVAILLLIFSLSLVWSEVTFFSSNPTLSIFAILVDITKKDYMFFSIEVVSCLTIAYMCACTYYTVFKMKLFNYYYFASNHQTDSNSLLFSGLLLCRLTYALCLNFLAMIHMDGHITGQADERGLSETDFTRFMGHLDLLSFISKGLNVYYPIIVLFVCFCTYFSLGKRILHCCGHDQFIIDDDFSADLVSEGKQIAKREKRKIGTQNNKADASERSKDVQSKYTRFGRKNDVQRLEDTDDNKMVSVRTEDPNVYIKKTSAERVRKYSAKTNDKLDLLSNIECESTEPTTVRYHSSVPRNIFDDT